MLVSLKEILKDCECHKYAVGSFNTPTLETLRAVIHAAEGLGVPVVLNHAENEEEVIPIEVIAPLMTEYAKNAKVPVAVHIDHGETFPYLMKAVRLGFTSIMYDCSHLPHRQNMEKVKRFVELVHPLGISVEAEIGAMPNNMAGCANGHEKSDLSNLEKYFTDPEEAADFAKQTGVDALAVSFGTVHGSYEGEPKLDIERVERIKALMPEGTALVMHGGSGTGKEQTRAAVTAGIRKINYFTAMDTAPAPVLFEVIKRVGSEPVHYGRLARLAMEVMEEKVKEAMEIFLNSR